MLSRPQLVRLVQAGYSDAEIAEKVGVSDRTVLRWRKKYGLASQWVPATLPCGTLANYRRGCRCEDCRAANAESISVYQAAFQARTRLAPRQTTFWTQGEDSYLLDPANGTIVERARVLGRTYYGARERLRLLARRQEAATN